jgi:hypothetical protein
VAVLEHTDDFSTATCELWLPVEPHNDPVSISVDRL